MEKNDSRKLGFQSLCCHAGQHADPVTGAHNTSIYQTSTFAFDNVKDGVAKFAGEKMMNNFNLATLAVSLENVEDIIADLEGALESI